MRLLGIDTSNYATSVAVYDAETHTVAAHVKTMLDAEPNHLGLRQSDAVFAHIKQLPTAYRQVLEQAGPGKITAVGVSAKPRDVAGSYMPCFLAGVGGARLIADTLGVPLFFFSHQAGHIMAALYGCGFAGQARKRFLAFHVSGGTTDAVVCELEGAALTVEPVASSLDVYAGQIVDRVGHKLGLPFPAGAALSALAATCDTADGARPALKGRDCCLSGLENQCAKLIEQGKDSAYVARFCLNSLAYVFCEMLGQLRGQYSGLDVIFAGGVMSSDIIRATLRKAHTSVYFCEPAWLSADNAAGIAILAGRALQNGAQGTSEARI